MFQYQGYAFIIIMLRMYASGRPRLRCCISSGDWESAIIYSCSFLGFCSCGLCNDVLIELQPHVFWPKANGQYSLAQAWIGFDEDRHMATAIHYHFKFEFSKLSLPIGQDLQHEVGRGWPWMSSTQVCVSLSHGKMFSLIRLTCGQTWNKQ